MSAEQNQTRELLVGGLIESAIKIGLLAMMIILCFKIVEPFLPLVLWGGILAIALYPVSALLGKRFGFGRKPSAILISVVLLAILIVPLVYIGESLIEGSGEMVEIYKEGRLAIPQPSQGVAEWPLVGEKVFDTWKMFADNSHAAAEKFKPQIQQFGKWLLTSSANAGFTTLFFIASILLAGFFMVIAGAARDFFAKTLNRINRDQGEMLVDLSVKTIRSVAQGVIGIAFIQAILAMPGIFLMDIPFAGLWVVAILILAIVQLPILIVIGPMIFYVYSSADSTAATVFAVYMVIVALSESVLKPLLLGRGLDVPMLIILIGAIGGMLMSGIIGLFTGATILALGYTLFTVWVNDDLEEQVAGQPADSETPAG